MKTTTNNKTTSRTASKYFIAKAILPFVVVIMLIIAIVIGADAQWERQSVTATILIYIGVALGGMVIHYQIKDHMERKFTEQLGEIEQESQKANLLRTMIFLRLSMREMTGKEACKIMKELLSKTYEELIKIKDDLISGEAEFRDQLLSRIYAERELSDEEKEETRKFLEPLNLSELEMAEEQIFGKRIDKKLLFPKELKQWLFSDEQKEQTREFLESPKELKQCFSSYEEKEETRKFLEFLKNFRLKMAEEQYFEENTYAEASEEDSEETAEEGSERASAPQKNDMHEITVPANSEMHDEG